MRIHALADARAWQYRTVVGPGRIVNQKIDPLLPRRRTDPVSARDKREQSTTSVAGETWGTMVPGAAPDIPASEMRTMSLTPAYASFVAIGR